MQEILHETLDHDNHEPSLNMESNTKKTVSKGLCFKCGGVVSAVEIGIKCEICQDVVYHAACVTPIEDNNNVDIFCCQQCDDIVDLVNLL